MKIGIKLDLYVMKEHFIATLCEKQMLVRIYPKVVKWYLKCKRGRSPKSQIDTGCDHVQHEGLPAHRTDKCNDFSLWNVVPFLN